MNFENKNLHARIGAASTTLLLLFAMWASFQPGPAAATPVDRIMYSSHRGTDYDIFAVNVDGTHERFVVGGSLDQMQPEISPDGRRMIFLNTVGVSCCGPGTDMYVANSDGRGIEPLFPPDPNIDDYRSDFSPDGSRIAFSRGATGGGVANVFTASPDGTDLHQLTLAGSNVASWSPDGQQLVFVSGLRLWVMDADGSNKHAITDVHSGADTSPQWSPNGDRIAFGSTRDALTTAEVYTLRPDGSDVVRLTTNGAEDRYATWSPDGTQIAFTSDREKSGQFTIWVMNSDGSGQRRISPSNYRAAFPVYFPHPRPGASRQGPN